MTDRRDPNGRYRQPRQYEAIVDHLRAKDAAAAARIGLVPTPSPATPDDERLAATLQDRQR